MQGTIVLAMTEIDEEVDKTKIEDLHTAIDKTVVSILSGENLLKADFFGASDPFAVIRFGGVKIGRTATISDTLNPVWKNESFDIHFPRSTGANNMELSIELWDEDLGGMLGDFLGCVEIGVEMLLHPPSGGVTFELVNRFGWPNNLKKKKRITGR